jgi:hypothetical protein
MAEDFLNKKQVDKLKSHKWIVKPKGFIITYFSDEVDSDVWEKICEIAGVSPSVSELSILSFGTIAK